MSQDAFLFTLKMQQLHFSLVQGPSRKIKHIVASWFSDENQENRELR